jgi:CRP-like cAMP-binding protein
MSIDDDIVFLEGVPTLHLLGRGALRILAIGAENRNLEEGEVLFKAGDKADCGFVIQDGWFRLIKPKTTEAEDKMVGPRSLLGEIALLTDTVRPVTAVALEPAAVMRISRSLFLKTLEGFPDAAERLRDNMASRFNQSAREILSIRTQLTDAEKKPED